MCLDNLTIHNVVLKKIFRTKCSERCAFIYVGDDEYQENLLEKNNETYNNIYPGPEKLLAFMDIHRITDGYAEICFVNLLDVENSESFITNLIEYAHATCLGDVQVTRVVVVDGTLKGILHRKEEQ